MHNIHYFVLVFVISLLLASLMYQPILRVARKYGIYDNPEARKLQRIPIPVMGGFVVFFSAIIGSLCSWFFFDCTSIVPVQVAMLIMLMVGFLDDRRNLSPYTELTVQIIVIIALALVKDSPIDNLHGLWGIYDLSPWIAWPLTVFACVGIINAINMIDGVDGLSSGMCIMIFAFYTWIFIVGGDYVHAAYGICVLGALIPFFIMNVFGQKSKMFIGDAGTMMLGILICDMVMSILTTGSQCSMRLSTRPYCLPAFILAALAVPVFDTLRVMFSRIWRRRSPLRPDKTHLHHAFIAYGFHHLETALLEIILNMLVIMFCFVLSHFYIPIEWQLYGVITAGISITVGLYWILVIHRRKNPIITKIDEQQQS
jgi:UDP-N-acetylmuramyl pentapeptide phosphotransferase/UDP-N-acetylglucosamine-1-phosphate transferase